MVPNSTAGTNPRSFYRIIFPSIIRDHKLSIPEDFAKIYEDELAAVATLMVPNGRVFRVEVEKFDKTLWLHNGWKQFSDYNSIRCGFFLVFDYEGNSKFKIHIYDLTATEIQYPKKSSIGICEELKHGNNKHKVRKCQTRFRSVQSLISRLDSNISEKVFNECPLRGVKRKRCFHSMLSNLFEFAPEFAMRINSYGKCISKFSFDGLRSNFQYLTRNKRCKVEDLSKTSKAMSKAIVVYNSHSKTENHLNTKNDKTSVRNCNSRGVKKGQYFDDDSGILESVTQTDKESLESESQTDKDGEESISPSSSSIQGMGKASQTAFSEALMLKLKNLYFIHILKQYNIEDTSTLRVPVFFANQLISTEYLKLEDVEGKQWEISCDLYNGKVQSLSCGWSVFVRDNNLAEGDVCVFELIQVRKVVLKVHIFYAFQTSLRSGISY